MPKALIEFVLIMCITLVQKPMFALQMQSGNEFQSFKPIREIHSNFIGKNQGLIVTTLC
jgi:hypothetical protein